MHKSNGKRVIVLSAVLVTRITAFAKIIINALQGNSGQ